MHDPPALVPDSRAPGLVLYGGFTLVIDDVETTLPVYARKVLAYLALHRPVGKFCYRTVLAEHLWPARDAERSRASLRTALWRIRSTADGLIDVDAHRIRLGSTVRVDVDDLRRQAETVLRSTGTHRVDDTELLVDRSELLPEWDDEWLLAVRERLRQLRFHAMETVARNLVEQGRFAEAIDIALLVVAEDPLRESAQAALIDAHLGEGNICEAIRQFRRFAAELDYELGVHPSAELVRKVWKHDADGALTSSRHRH